MSRLTRGIETDVGTALARMRESNLKTEAARKVHEETIRNLRASLTRQEERSDVFQAINSELDNALENGRLLESAKPALFNGFCFITIRRLVPEISSYKGSVKEELEKTNQAKVIKEREYEQLKNTLESTRRIVAVLTTGNNILQSQTGTLAESKLELERTVIRLRKEAIETRDAYLETERHVRTLLDETRQENNSIKDEHRREVEKLQHEMELLRVGIANQQDDMILKNMDENNSLKGFRKEGVDPIADMTRQLDTNREKIEVLTRQNERLSKTLQRLKDYRLSGQTVSSGQKK
ncbi:uncharacterized protein LOC143208488 [Lasioglossum baleicum]|uniref:uncharacterized protein LOC143208488 n=1 Tax=Lasioglossum baleicum TaxID=434251 RepID=UPI003FCE41D8